LILLIICAVILFGRLTFLLLQDKPHIIQETNLLNYSQHHSNFSDFNISRNYLRFHSRNLSSIPAIDLLRSQKKSMYAYVTLVHGMDSKVSSYRGFLYNAIVAAKTLRSKGSMADFIVMYGFSSILYRNDSIIKADLDLLHAYGILTYEVPRLLDDSILNHNNYVNPSCRASKMNFLEMALLKITPLSFTQYERIQFIDADVFPHKNMDCYFSLSMNTFNTGNMSPLNSGWFLAIPNMTEYNILHEMASRRRCSKWNETIGWGRFMPDNIYYRGGTRKVMKWDFNGASLDQGLLMDFFFLQRGSAQLVDVAVTYTYTPSTPTTAHQNHVTSNKLTLGCCDGLASVHKFHHFTGRSKPWLQNLITTTNPALKHWAAVLDSLHLTVNSSNIHLHKLKPPLGYFYPNKR